MNAIDIVSPYLAKFLFIFLRASLVLMLLPFFGNQNMPAQFKIGFIVALSVVLTPVVKFDVHQGAVPFLVMREIVFGLLLGLAARFVFFGIEMAGHLMSNAMGLSIATSFDPEMGQSTAVSSIYGILAMLIFLAMDAHHDLIYIFVRSYELAPVGSIEVRNLAPEAIAITGRIFMVAMKLSAPVVIIMVLTNLLLGFLSKAAPQMNVFFVGFPVYVVVGFTVMILGLPVFAQVSGTFFSDIENEMVRIIGMAKG
ncbi:MAG TPA: flagellar biosynthetic protein FliR [Thermodesulfovibrionales bacterium]|nr:flagellar biosynthetic protein FliR [Thermodesulfovibrionales bacterium]